jgi:ankyrin repeat protein
LILSPRKDGRSALWWAAWEGWPRVVQELLNAGADYEALTHAGDNPLMAACLRGHFDVVRLLLEVGAKVNVQCGHAGTTPLMAVAYTGYADVARLLVKSSANLQLQNMYGNTALDLAKENKRTETVKELQRSSFSTSMLISFFCAVTGAAALKTLAQNAHI